MIRSRTGVLLGAMVLAAAAVGCGPSEVEILQTEVRELQRQVEDLEATKQTLTADVAERDQRIETLLFLGEKRLEKIVTVDGITLGRWSGGYDSDGELGDEGVKIYLSCKDDEGTTLKAAGAVSVRLVNVMAETDEEFLIGEFEWTVDELAKRWSSGMVGTHYSLECPWPDGPPTHREVTMRVEFVDYLTGKTFTAQRVGTVKFAGDEDEPLSDVPDTE